MKGNMLIFAPFCLLLCCMLPADAVPSLKLTMEENSVDDMYLGCKDAMMEKVKNEYIEKEKYNSQFSDVWKNTEDCAKKKYEKRADEDKALTKDHMHAICVYTGDRVYTAFNTAVRTGRSSYGSSFQFHSLHYLLTSAIQILNNNNNCETTYRRVRTSFTGEKHKIIRFGSFASSSKKTDLTNFGSETCFKIRTCSGAYLKKYSIYDDMEEEVLIPPYEKFTITEISDDPGKFKDLKDCKRVFVLESAGVESRLNCKLAHSGASRGRCGIISMFIIIIISIIIVIIRKKNKKKNQCTSPPPLEFPAFPHLHQVEGQIFLPKSRRPTRLAPSRNPRESFKINVVDPK